MQTNLHVIRLLIAIAAIITTAPVFASDGQLEINQACAVNTGCFPGDAPGFPVTITTPGSYRLTGSLDLSAEGVNVSGIAVSVPAVTIDLGGFHIAGPTSCSGSGTNISCSPSSTGVGVAGVQFTINATAGVVQNGIVRNMTNFGILSQATGLRVQDVTAIHNGRDGITGSQGSLVVNSVAIENGQDGIDVNTGSVVDGVTAIGNGRNGINGQGTSSVVTRTSVRQNGMHGFSLGLQYKFGKNNVSSANGEADQCGGGICTEQKRFYLTQNRHQGDTVLSACTIGFHTASHTELQGLASYAYDYVLGITVADSGSGAPVSYWGWIRSGQSTGLNIFNCDGWTRGDGTDRGTAIKYNPIHVSISDQVDDPSHLHNSTYYDCNVTVRVWCVED